MSAASDEHIPTVTVKEKYVDNDDFSKNSDDYDDNNGSTIINKKVLKNTNDNVKNTLPDLNKVLEVDLNVLRDAVKNRNSNFSKKSHSNFTEKNIQSTLKQEEIPKQQQQHSSIFKKSNNNNQPSAIKFVQNFISSIKNRLTNKKENISTKTQQHLQQPQLQQSLIQKILIYGGLFLLFLFFMFTIYMISYSIIGWVVNKSYYNKGIKITSNIESPIINEDNSKYSNVLNNNREQQVKEYILYLMRRWLDQTLSPLDLNEMQSNCYTLLSKTQYFEKLMEPLLELIKLDVCSAKNKNLIAHKASIWFTDIANKKIEQLLELIELE